MAGSLAAPVICGLAVGSAFVLLFSVSNVVPTLCGGPGLQISAPSLEQQIRYSDAVVYGTVLSAELHPVYYYDQFGEFRTDLRYTVTVFADRYIMDKTGEGTKIITFEEYGFGCAYPFRSEVYADNWYAVEHKKGEKAIFFVDKLDEPVLDWVEGSWHSFALFDKYAIVGEDEDDEKNKLVQNKYNARNGRGPMTVAQLEAEISEISREIGIQG
ncbi:MAG TPA: hypothetical protein VF172_12780 [Nitrososphaera sp.]